MHYSMQHILSTRYDKNRSAVRKMEERFVILSAITKALSPAPTYLFLNLGLRPDAITIASFAFNIAGSVLIVLGYPAYGVICYLVFALLDSADGDMARCSKGSRYGATLDSFGADILYALAPIAVGYHLFAAHVSVRSYPPVVMLMMGALVSASFMFYRLVNAKVQLYRNKLGLSADDQSAVAKQAISSGSIRGILALYRHTIIRQNFFAEAGLLLWFAVLIVSHQYQILAWYVAAILAYNVLYLTMNAVGTYVYFRKSEAENA